LKKRGKDLEALSYGAGTLEEIRKYQREERDHNTPFDPFEELKNDPAWTLKAE
jgi:hypothetical protein